MIGITPIVGGIVAQAADWETPAKKITPREKIAERMFPNVVLTTHEDKQVRFYDDLIKDKIVVINFMYANCEGVCPGITMNMAKVQKALGSRVGREIFFYSITLKPEKDTPKVLKDYARMHGAGPGWLFLTGKPSDIEMIRRKQGFVDPDPEQDKDTSNHIGNLRYGNESRMLWGACPGMASTDFILESILWMYPRKKNGKEINGAAKASADR
jgi:protein SCO1/2